MPSQTRSSRGARSKTRSSTTNQTWLMCFGIVALLLIVTLFLEELPNEDHSSALSGGGSVSQVDSVVPSPSPLPVIAELPNVLALPAPALSALRTPMITWPSKLIGRPPPTPKADSSIKPLKPAQDIPYPMRVFVYDDVAAALYRNLRSKEACMAPYSAAEVAIPDLVARSSLYTKHGELADYYLVPVLSECFMLTRLHSGFDFSRAAASLNKAFSITLDSIQSKYPFWSRTEGRDHIFIFPTERGPSILTDANLQRIRKSIFVVGTMRRSSTRFDTWKDIVIPPARGPWTPEPDRLPAPPNRADPGAPGRTTVLHFRGNLPGQSDLNPYGVRNVLAKNLKREEGIVFEQPTADCGRQCTREEMLKSQYCLVPSGGVEGWSLRFYDAVALGCVPYVIADDMEFPFENRIDYSSFSVKVLEAKAENTADHVRQLGSKRYAHKEKALMESAKPFVWHDEWREGDAFDFFLKELHFKLRFMRNSPYRFWSALLPGG